MNPLLQEQIASLLRHLLSGLAGVLVAYGLVNESQAATFIGAIASFLVAAAWGLWQKYTSRSKLVTALAASTPMAEVDVQDMVKDPNIPTPSPASSKTEVPRA